MKLEIVIEISSILSLLCVVYAESPNQLISTTTASPKKYIQKTKKPGTKNTFSSEYLYPPLCGFSRNSIKTKIVEGSEVPMGAYPWMAAIGFRFGNGTDDIVFVCGGSLITNRHILTAAHCLVFEDVSYFARLGAHHLQKPDEANPIDFNVQKLIGHPLFNDTTKANDIAILKLQQIVTFTPAIHPICLPLKSEIRDQQLIGTYMYVAGWGSTSFNGPESDVLRDTEVPIIDNKKCENEYKNESVVIDDKKICAGYANGKSDACQGDSGGPLMLLDNYNYYQVGVVSTGFRCAFPGYAGIYTRVTSYLRFIITNLKD